MDLAFESSILYRMGISGGGAKRGGRGRKRAATYLHYIIEVNAKGSRARRKLYEGGGIIGLRMRPRTHFRLLATRDITQRKGMTKR